MASPLSAFSRRSFLKSLAALPFASGVTAALPGMVSFAQEGGLKVVTALIGAESPGLLSLVSTAGIAWSAKTNEGLLTFDHDLNPQPLLATSWEVAPDGLTYTFKIREGVKFHDGTEMTAEDVAFSLETSKKYHSRNRATFAQVTSIETPDSSTVILRLEKPVAYLLTALSSVESPVVPRHLYADGTDPLQHPINTAPIGTGPYKFNEWVRGSHIIFDRNPDYWDTDFPQVDRIVVKVIADPAARVIAFETGDVDFGNRTPVPFRDLDNLEQLPHIAFEDRGYTYDPPNITILEANVRDADLAKLAVRQAIAHTLDREALVRILYHGRALPSASAVVPYHKEFHLAEPSPYPYDIAAAEALLEGAGYPKRSDGTRLNLTLDFFSEERRIASEFLRASMARAGIAVELRGQDSSTIVKRVYGDQDYQLHLASISNLYDPQVGVQRLYWSKNIIPGVAYSNGTGYTNPEVDALLEAAAVETIHAERVRMWHEIQRIVAAEVPNFPLLAPQWLTIYNTRIDGHTTGGEGPLDGSLRELKIVA